MVGFFGSRLRGLLLNLECIHASSYMLKIVPLVLGRLPALLFCSLNEMFVCVKALLFLEHR